MGEVDERNFSFSFAAWKASRFWPKGRARGEGVDAYLVFARAFEKEIELAGYRIVKAKPAARPHSGGD